MGYVTRARILLRRKLRSELTSFLARLTAGEIANILSRMNEKNKRELFMHISSDKRPRVLLLLKQSDRDAILRALSDREIADIILQLASDDACRILRNLGEERADFVLSYLPKSRRVHLAHQMRYSKEVAGGIMQKEMMVASEKEKVGDVLEKIRKAEKHTWLYDVYIIDGSNRLVGRVPMSKLIRAEREERVGTLMETDPVCVSVIDDREKVVKIFKDKHILSIPVVEKGRLVGVITIDEALHIIEEEYTEDLFKMFSLDKEEHIHDPLKKSIRNRTPWLMINLLTAFLAASVVGLFEDVLKSFVLFAIFMPVVAGEGGNATTQTMAVVVRALALREISTSDFIRVVKTELMIAISNGFFIGVVACILAFLWKSSILVGLALFLAMIINLVVAAVFGAVIPLLLERLGSDPASSSTVLLTTFTDIFGFMSFLGIGSLLLMWIG